jgi:hypothetical protein
MCVLNTSNGRSPCMIKLHIWVYKRKTGKGCAVTRYRARLVAQSYLQRPCDSFIPEETYSPVVHRESLRLFLSVPAAESLMVSAPFAASLTAALARDLNPT